MDPNANLRLLTADDAMHELRQSLTVLANEPDICDGHVAAALPGEDGKVNRLAIAYHDDANSGMVVLEVPIPPTSDQEEAAENVEDALERGHEVAHRKAWAVFN